MTSEGFDLTGRYTHSRSYDLVAALNNLPPLLSTGLECEALAATGTEGNSACPNLRPYPLFRDIMRDKLRQNRGCGQTKNPGKQAGSADFQGTQQIPDKVEPRGIEPLTSALRTLRSPS